MSIEFNHTILAALDARASGEFLAEMIWLPAQRQWGPFWMVTTENGVNLDYMNFDRSFVPQHYAFLATDTEFDRLLNRLHHKSLRYWADPSINGLSAEDRRRVRQEQSRPLVNDLHAWLQEKRAMLSRSSSVAKADRLYAQALEPLRRLPR